MPPVREAVLGWLALVSGLAVLTAGSQWIGDPSRSELLPLLIAPVVSTVGVPTFLVHRWALRTRGARAAAVVATACVLAGSTVAALLLTSLPGGADLPGPVELWLLGLAVGAAGAAVVVACAWPAPPATEDVDVDVDDATWREQYAVALRERGDLTEDGVSRSLARVEQDDDGTSLARRHGPAARHARRAAGDPRLPARRQALLWTVLLGGAVWRLVDLVAEHGWRWRVDLVLTLGWTAVALAAAVGHWRRGLGRPVPTVSS